LLRIVKIVYQYSFNVFFTSSMFFFKYTQVLVLQFYTERMCFDWLYARAILILSLAHIISAFYGFQLKWLSMLVKHQIAPFLKIFPRPLVLRKISLTSAKARFICHSSSVYICSMLVSLSIAYIYVKSAHAVSSNYQNSDVDLYVLYILDIWWTY